MEISCSKCKRTFGVDPDDVHGRVVNKKATSVLQCTCGNHVFPATK
jgi:hypothetical protein